MKVHFRRLGINFAFLLRSNPVNLHASYLCRVRVISVVVLNAAPQETAQTLFGLAHHLADRFDPSIMCRIYVH